VETLSTRGKTPLGDDDVTKKGVAETRLGNEGKGVRSLPRGGALFQKANKEPPEQKHGENGLARCNSERKGAATVNKPRNMTIRGSWRDDSKTTHSRNRTISTPLKRGWPGRRNSPNRGRQAKLCNGVHWRGKSQFEDKRQSHCAKAIEKWGSMLSVSEAEPKKKGLLTREGLV